MKVQQLQPIKFVVDTPQWYTALEALNAGQLQKIRVPIVKPEGLSTLVAQSQQRLSEIQLQDLVNARINLNVHFSPHPETQLAFSTF